jgi:uncharacterized repeat protein (TIGR03803 family)
MKVNGCATIFQHQEAHWLTRTGCTLLIFCFATAIASQAQKHDVLVRFVNPNGGNPTSLVQGADGNFYGVGITGGHNAAGSFFKVTPAGGVTRLYVFCPVKPCSNGKTPNGLILASDGNFYGTTHFGGELHEGPGPGTVFRMTPGGVITTLHIFCSAPPSCTDGFYPEGDLVQGSDGALYGTTSIGGTHYGGTIFKITISGEFTSLYNFCSEPSCADGATPAAGLVEASNGAFYGTTSRGGANPCNPYGGCGTLFRISASGKLTTLYSFCAQPNCADGMFPATGLLQAADGKIYGATSSGGLIDGTCTTGCGTTFRISPSGGPPTLLHAFTSSEGAQVQRLIQATDGSVYGTARLGGSSNLGTLFKMDPAGSVTVLFNFCNAAACHFSTNPVGLIQSTNGLFYGTTTGPGNGTLYTFGFPPFITMTPSSGPVGTMVKIYGTDLSGATEVTFNGGVSATFTIVSPGEIDASVPAGALFGPVKVITPAATLVSNVVFRVAP